MGSGCVHNCGYVLITMLVVALLFGLIALGIPYWYKTGTTYSTGASGDQVATITREGLWKKCTDLEYTSDSSSFCVDNDATSAIKGLRWTLMVSSGVLGIACLAGGAAHMEKNRTAFVVTAVHGIIAAILKIVVGILYATVVRDDIGFETDNLYAGWALTMVAALLSIMSAFVSLILARCVAPSKVADNSGEGGKNKTKTDDITEEKAKNKKGSQVDVKKAAEGKASAGKSKDKKNDKNNSQTDLKKPVESVDVDW